MQSNSWKRWSNMINVTDVSKWNKIQFHITHCSLWIRKLPVDKNFIIDTQCIHLVRPSDIFPDYRTGPMLLISFLRNSSFAIAMSYINTFYSVSLPSRWLQIDILCQWKFYMYSILVCYDLQLYGNIYACVKHFTAVYNFRFNHSSSYSFLCMNLLRLV